VFRKWSSRWQQGSDPVADLTAFDARMGRLETRASSVEEDLAIRRAGAQRLMILQTSFAVMQLLLLDIALLP
jgi:hypothetical protein